MHRIKTTSGAPNPGPCAIYRTTHPLLPQQLLSNPSEITWNCDLDWNFMKNCLPSYNFRILDDYGWNFRHAFYHEENRRTLIKG